MFKRIALTICSIVLVFFNAFQPATAEKNEIGDCINSQARRLDDGISSAEIIAKGVMSACDGATRRFVNERQLPEGLDRLRALESLRESERIRNKIIEIILLNRTSKTNNHK